MFLQILAHHPLKVKCCWLFSNDEPSFINIVWLLPGKMHKVSIAEVLIAYFISLLNLFLIPSEWNADTSPEIEN